MLEPAHGISCRGGTRRGGALARFDALRGDLRGRALAVVLACLVCQLALGYGYMLSPLLKQIAEDLGVGRTAVTLGRAPMLTVGALASPLVGLWVARSGPRIVVVVSTLVLGASWCAIANVRSVPELLVMSLFVGFPIAGLGDITIGAVVTQWVRRGRGLALGLAYAGSNIGGAILVPLVAWLTLELGSWRRAVMAIGVGGVALLLPFAAGLVRPPRPEERPAEEEAPRDAHPAAPAPAAEALGSPDDLTLAQALRTRSFWILGFSLASFFAYFVAMIEHMVAYFSDSGLDDLAAAWRGGAAIAIGVLSKIGFGLVADRLPERTSLLVDYALLALSSLLLLALPLAEGLLPLFLVVYGVSTAARDVVYPLIITHAFGARHLAEIYGALMVVLPVGALGSIFAAQVFDRSGSYAPAFATFAALNIASLAALAFVRPERRGDA